MILSLYQGFVEVTSSLNTHWGNKCLICGYKTDTREAGSKFHQDEIKTHLKLAHTKLWEEYGGTYENR